MPGRAEVELTNAVEISTDVTDLSHRQTNQVAIDHDRIYVFLEKKDDPAGDSGMEMGKSLDGGNNWNYTGLEDTRGTNIAGASVWYEKWTPTTAGTGFKTGTKIHQAWTGVGGGYMGYTWMDTVADTWRSGADHGLINDTEFANCLKFAGVTVRTSIFETSDGELHIIAGDDDVVTGPMHWRSTDGGDNWTRIDSATVVPDSSLIDDDEVGAIPIGDNKILFFAHDLSLDEIFYNVWDNDDDTWHWVRLIQTQDETSYDNSPTSEGTFAGGSGYALNDTITMSDGSSILVNAVSGDVVSEFTVTTIGTTAFNPGDTLTQSSTSGGGSNFTLTPDSDNLQGGMSSISTGYQQGTVVTGATYDLLWIPKDGTWNRLVVSQDETSYDNSPTTEGTFAGGTGYTAADSLTMSDGTTVTVDTVSGGVVTEFTVAATAGTDYFKAGDVLTATGGTGNDDFTLTPDTDNMVAVELVLVSIAVDPLIQATGADLDFWSYDVALDTWTQKTSPVLFSTRTASNDFLGDNALTYLLDTGKLYYSYFSGDVDGLNNGVYFKTSDDMGKTWSGEFSANSTQDHLMVHHTNRYSQEVGGGIVNLFYGNDDLNRWYVANLDVLYPHPITTDYTAAAYSGVIGDWTIDMDGPTSKGLEAISGGIGVKWQNQISPYSAGFWKAITPIDITAKVLLVTGETLIPAAIGTFAQGGLRMRMVDSDDNYAEWYMGGSDSLSGAETLLVAGDATPDEEGTTGANPSFRALSTASTAASATQVIGHPAGMADNDYVIIWALSDDGTNTVTSWPSGFVEQKDENETGRSSAYATKLITDAAGEGTWTVTFANSAAVKVNAMAYQNVNSTFPIGTDAYGYVVDTITPTPPEITVGYGGSMSVILGTVTGLSNQTNAGPAGYVERQDDYAQSMLTYVGDDTVGGGLTSTDTIDWKNGVATDDSLIFHIALSPNYGFDKTDVVELGFYYRTASAVLGKEDPPWVFKNLKAGSFIRVRGGTTGAHLEMDDVRQWDAFFGFGLISRSGNYFAVSAQLYFGESTGNDTFDTYFTDTNKIIAIPPSGVGDDFLHVTIDGSPNTTTEVYFGNSIGSGASTVGFGGMTFDSAPNRFGAQDKLTINVINDDVDIFAMYGCKLLEGKTVNFGNAANPLSDIDLRVVDTAFDGYEQIKRRVTDGALLWLRNQIVGESVSGIGMTLEDTTIVDLEELSVYNAFDGIKLTQTGTIDFTGVNFGANTKDVFNDSGGAVTINVLGGGDTPSYRNGVDATTTVVNAVGVKVTVKDASTLSTITGARVLIKADTGGPLPAGDSVSITHVTTTATVTHTDHGLTSGDKVDIDGAIPSEYLGSHTITVTGASSYTYVMTGDPGADATGTPTSTAVILDGDTNGSGVVEDTGFNFASSQPIVGRVRKGSSSTYYKTSAIPGTITANGFEATVLMVRDQ